MAGALNMKVVKTGRFKAPVLTSPVLTRIGNEMVDNQKARWSMAVNADGAKAAPLGFKYRRVKAKIRKVNRPVRDLFLTGLLKENFTLRKAANGIIRAEPTSRKGREHATSANTKDQMIGFSGHDVKVVYDETQTAFGHFAKEMWVPIG